MIKYVEYIETDGSEILYTLTNAIVSSIDDVLYFDFMPLNGTVHYDGWYAFLAGNVGMRTTMGGYSPNGPYGISFCDGGFSTWPSPFTVGNKYECVFNKNGIIINGVMNNFTTTATSVGTISPLLMNGTTKNDAPFRCPVGKYYGLKIMSNSTVVCDYKPVLDDNDNPCFYDEISHTKVYHVGAGTPTAGPVLHIFYPSKTSLRFDATGGTDTFDVEAETTWTASTPTFVSLSPSTGDTGTTTVTVTCPSWTGETRREELVTFTDNDSYTFDVKMRQRALSNGFSNLYLGDNQIPTANAIYLGDVGVNTIYLGEEIVYSSGPFVGLKAAPQSLTLTNLANTANITIRSSEDWTITDDSGGWLSYSTTTGTTGKTVVTVTASTTQAERTATITVTSANYSATVGVTDKARLYLVPNDEIWYHQTGNNPIYPMRDYNQGNTWWVETDMTTSCYIISNTYDSNDGWWKIKWSGPLGRTTGTGFGQGFAAAMTEVMMPETMKREETHNWTYSTNLKKICYGASMESFAERVFNYMYLENIYIYAETCPTFTRPNTQWEYYGGTGVTLHYPAGSDYSSFPLPPNSTRIGDL